MGWFGGEPESGNSGGTIDLSKFNSGIVMKETWISYVSPVHQSQFLTTLVNGQMVIMQVNQCKTGS